MTRIVKRGNDWQLGWDADTKLFKGLVGTDKWALELTETEFADFVRLLLQLSETMTDMSSELMDEEAITCEAESDLLWLEVEGFPHAYSLHMILLTGRRGEGRWSAAVVPELIQAAQQLQVF